MNTHTQRGGTFLGFIMGLVLGLGVALAVAIYVTKVPTPFSSKNQPRTTEQDNAESQKNKDWNPNGVLQPKPPAEVPATPATQPSLAEDKASDKAAEKSAEKTHDKAHSDSAKSEPRPAVTADPLGDLAKSKSGMSTPAPGNAPASEPFDYFIQVGAYRTSADADAQKAKLALMGLDAKVSERDQAGRTVYRVRLGAFADKNAAERVRKQLDGGGIENTLVRVQR
jgi:cell division protein FtsN